jgi:hypothetical protein
MSYTHSAKLDYAEFLEKVFDSEPRERLPTCSCGPIRLYGGFEGTAVRVDVCSDGTTWVFARSQKKADNLAKRMEEKIVGLARKLAA